MTLVVDASVALKWYIAEPGSEAARHILAGGELLAAPELIVAEVCNGAWLAWRRQEITAAHHGQIAVDIAAALDRIESPLPHAGRAAAIAREIDHPVYDCFYLALSEALDAPLVTADRRLLARVAGTPFAARTRDLRAYAPRP
jgi:predicted nucleic acid-binding protein